ncbi:anhydro-N-acetylmuramic acid kinase [Arenibacter certesii]|uniref:Anhydro-N-acetylmuramic acid kinase n=1 Tax=Arenibacter certesii TaxID=228955 RepID=A0A918MKJ0_9FLAO|nr:anhydro-N-acetylmuramic acid kinase [Arenibacter certesii]GGW30919.1 anhydro-N-acetylmuramic acid kinase [Arenibacter certesii]
MKIYKVLGLMSGTSLDGLDLTYCHIWKTPTGWDFDIKNTDSIPYSDTLKEKLKNAIYLPADTLLEFHNTYGTWLGKQSKEFIKTHELEAHFIGSHGHTTHHQPQKGFTFQIGSGQHLANESGIKVICDFRSNDVALGGQGAPLVPLGDRLFFGQYDYCLNLGGISNISFERNGERLAYDIGLANMILNHITQKINLNYDKDGALARKGSINKPMLEQLNNLEFYKLPFPKSIGFEWFVAQVVPIVEANDDNIENLLHTSIHHICDQIAKQVELQKNKTENTLFVTGGGALNGFLMETLQEKVGSNTKVVKPTNLLVEFKEALIFALMAVLREENSINCLRSVTGAKRDCSGGVIYLPA